MKWLFVAAASCAIVASTSCRMPPRDLSGRWQGTMRYTEVKAETSKVKLLLVENGRGLTGILQWNRADHVVVDFKITSGVVSEHGEISLDGEGGNALFRVPMTFEGQVDGNTIEGTVEMRVPTGLLSDNVTAEIGQLSVGKD
jgi:2-methylaconitate cis-trans-isomerase PrpF